MRTPVPLADRVNEQRWETLCAAMQIRNARNVYAKLIHAWSGRARHYHCLTHLAACLREMDSVRDLAERPAEVELALWFHDAVYRTYRSDNEARSAAWARDFLQSNALPEAAGRVHELIMATRHTHGEFSGDAALVVDIDLSILGRDADVYDEFELNVRREYWWVPRRRYVVARVQVLRSLLDRPHVYQLPQFRERFELAARMNMQRAISALQASI